jgi:RND family efflux transporter MFP subunit
MRPQHIVALTLTLIAVAGCKPRNQFVPPPPPKVTVAQPMVREMVDYMEFSGTTRATAEVELRARVNGYLKEILFEDGSQVQQGDLLFVIESAPFESALLSAKARLVKAQREFQLADVNLVRARALAPQRVVSQQELDIREAERATAAADVDVAAADVRQAELNVGYTTIHSPLTGRIGRHLIDIGSLVQSEQTLLAKVESLDPIHAYFHVSDRDLAKLQTASGETLGASDANGSPVLLGLTTGTEFPHQGRVDYREPSVDPATGTVLRRGIFPNHDQSLIPGLFVRIRAPLGEAQRRLVVEDRALGSDQRGDFVLVVKDDNTVEYRSVKLGVAINGLRVVEGVQPTDWIVVNGLQRARPGATVDPQRTTGTARTGRVPVIAGSAAPSGTAREVRLAEATAAE